MSCITPSFPSHGFGLLALNAVTMKISPAIAFRPEHVSGKQYALYLQSDDDRFGARRIQFAHTAGGMDIGAADGSAGDRTLIQLNPLAHQDVQTLHGKD